MIESIVNRVVTRNRRIALVVAGLLVLALAFAGAASALQGRGAAIPNLAPRAPVAPAGAASTVPTPLATPGASQDDGGPPAGTSTCGQVVGRVICSILHHSAMQRGKPMQRKASTVFAQHPPSISVALLLALAATALAVLAPITVLVTGPVLLGAGLGLRQEQPGTASLVLAMTGLLLLVVAAAIAVLLVAV